MDVMVQCEKDGMYKGEVFYIPIVIGDAKEHLFPDGLYQTGIPFNEDRGKDTDSAGNTVEFRGYDIQENYVIFLTSIRRAQSIKLSPTSPQ